MAKKEKNTNVIGVYCLKGIKGKSAIRIKHIDTFNNDQSQQLKDTAISEYEINGKKGIYGKVFARNITNNILMSSKKHPVIYISLYLVKPLKTALLYDLVLYFTINDDIKSYSEFLSNDINGKFTLELIKDDESRELDKEIKVFPGREQILKMLMDFTLTDEMNDILVELANIEEKKIAASVVNDYNYCSPPKPTLSLEDYISDS
jgi:hypothetical protein